MATNGNPSDNNLSADVMLQQAETTAQAILDRGIQLQEIGERTSRIVKEAIENYARHADSFINFCRQAEEQSRAAIAQLGPLTGRPQIDVDRFEREIEKDSRRH